MSFQSLDHVTLSVASAGVEFLKHNRPQTQWCVGTQTPEGIEAPFIYISWSYERHFFSHIVAGVYTPVSQNTKSFSLMDCLSIGVERMQGNIDPMLKVEARLQK